MAFRVRARKPVYGPAKHCDGVGIVDVMVEAVQRGAERDAAALTFSNFYTAAVVVSQPTAASADVYEVVLPRTTLMQDPHDPLQGEGTARLPFDKFVGFTPTSMFSLRLHLLQPSPLFGKHTIHTVAVATHAEEAAAAAAAATAPSATAADPAPGGRKPAVFAACDAVTDSLDTFHAFGQPGVRTAGVDFKDGRRLTDHVEGLVLSSGAGAGSGAGAATGDAGVGDGCDDD